MKKIEALSERTGQAPLDLLKGAIVLSERISRLPENERPEERRINDPALVAVEPNPTLRELYLRIKRRLETPHRTAGGEARAAKLSPERRREIAKLANSKRKANQEIKLKTEA